MRRLFYELSRFNRAERYGAVALAVVTSLFLLVKATMAWWVPPPGGAPAEEQQLAARWEAFRKAHGSTDTGRHRAHRWDEEEGPAIPVVLAPFDPNTIDSTGIRRLGLSARVAKSWLRWRDAYGKKFYDAEDLKPMYNLAPEDWTRIAPYVRSSLQRPARYAADRYERYEVPAFVSINTADTTLLDRAVRGIGPYLARRIIGRRDALGGYYTLEQVTEGLRIPDSTVAALREKLRFEPEKVRRLSLNGATPEQLKAHPYIGEKTAANILLFRGAIKQFESVEQLRQVPLMTGETFRKIAPYFKVD